MIDMDFLLSPPFIVEETLQQDPEDTADKNAHLNVKQNPQQNQITSMNQTTEIPRTRKPQKLPEKKDDFMNSMFSPMTKATSRTSHQQSSGACLISAKPPQSLSTETDKKRNASFVSDPKEMSHPKPIINTVDSPSPPNTPTSPAKKREMPHPKPIINTVDSPSPPNTPTSPAKEREMPHPKPIINTVDSPSPPITPTSPAKEREMPHPKPIINTVYTPSPPITPTSPAKEIGKPAMSVSPTNFQASNAQCETEVQDTELDIETPRVLASPLPSDFSGPGNNQLPHCAHLAQAVQMIYMEALRSSMDDIAPAMSAVNNLPTYANDVDSPAVSYCTGDEYTSCKKMKYDIDSVRGVKSALDNYGSCSKNLRKEVNNDLMDEIRQTNQRLIETVLKVDCDSDSSNETVIKCTYKPVSCSGSFMRQFGFMESILTLSIKILVPFNYPNTPLKILDRVPDGCCKETKDLTERARAIFDRCVRCLDSLGLGDMARAWDDSARSVISDYILGLGGESFSSKYGIWECVPPD
ncbi:mediator of RNA polymerase II transcription subunit 15a-like [Chenopodium quinoa]|nr:mediator of RNA polymerase II transcription subunit 15a-like [Chenopodium quinoa]